MIAIIDNGEAYSDHVIWFVEVASVAVADLLVGAANIHDLESYSVVAVVDGVEWRKPAAVDTSAAFVADYALRRIRTGVWRGGYVVTPEIAAMRERLSAAGFDWEASE